MSPHYKWDDSDPVSILLSLLMLNDIALAGVSGEVMTMINEHLKKPTPSIHTIMVTHTNGSSGYIPDDAAFEQISYEDHHFALEVRLRRERHRQRIFALDRTTMKRGQCVSSSAFS
jgi:hypothetical protein